MPPRRSDSSASPADRTGPGPARRATQPRLIAQPPDQLVVYLPGVMATRRLGGLLAADAQGGDIVALAGPLGAGKTCLVAGLARALGIRQAVASPSFSLVNQHVGRLTLYHVDLYRLGHESELAELGLWEAAESGGLLAIEWLERFPDAVSPDRLHVGLQYRAERTHAECTDGDTLDLPSGGRIAEIRATGPRSNDRLRALRQRLTD